MNKAVKAFDVFVEYLGKTAPSESFYQFLIKTKWKEIVGPRLYSSSIPDVFKKGVLTVYVKNITWKNNLSILERDFCKKISHVCGADVVKNIRLVSSPKKFLKKSSNSFERRVDNDIVLPEWAKKYISQVENEQLRTALRKFMSVSLQMRMKKKS